MRQKEPVFEKLVQLDQLAVGEVWVQIPVTRSIAKRDTIRLVLIRMFTKP